MCPRQTVLTQEDKSQRYLREKSISFGEIFGRWRRICRSKENIKEESAECRKDRC
jgi:hypothetical protein